MERVNIVVLASVAAALIMLALRLAWPGDLPELAAHRDSGAPRVASERTLPPRAGADTESVPERAAPPRERVPPESAPPSTRRTGGATGTSPNLAAGVERRRSVLTAAGRSVAAAGDAPVGRVVDSDLIARAGTLAPPRGGGRTGDAAAPDGTGRHVLEFVDEDPAHAPKVLFELPLDGDVKPAVGGGAVAADGLVTQGGAVEFPDGAELTVPVGGNLHSKSGSIAFDVQPQWSGADETNNSLVAIRDEHVWENTLAVVKNFDALRYIIIDSKGVERNVNIPIDDWMAGEIHHVVATWSQDSMALYVDGQLVGENTLDHPLNFRDATLMHIGSDFPGSTYTGAGGAIHDFTVYARPLSMDDVARR
jgi:hypothetical protein